MGRKTKKDKHGSSLNVYARNGEGKEQGLDHSCFVWTLRQERFIEYAGAEEGMPFHSDDRYTHRVNCVYDARTTPDI